MSYKSRPTVRPAFLYPISTKHTLLLVLAATTGTTAATTATTAAATAPATAEAAAEPTLATGLTRLCYVSHCC